MTGLKEGKKKLVQTQQKTKKKKKKSIANIFVKSLEKKKEYMKKVLNNK